MLTNRPKCGKQWLKGNVEDVHKFSGWKRDASWYTPKNWAQKSPDSEPPPDTQPQGAEAIQTRSHFTWTQLARVDIEISQERPRSGLNLSKPVSL